MLSDNLEMSEINMETGCQSLASLMKTFRCIIGVNVTVVTMNFPGFALIFVLHGYTTEISERKLSGFHSRF